MADAATPPTEGASFDDAHREAALGLAWLSPCGFHSLLRRLKEEGPLEVWAAPRWRLEGWGLRGRSIDEFIAKRASFSAGQAEAAVAERGLRFLGYGDPEFPRQLTQLSIPPAGIFVRAAGDRWRRMLESPRVTIVGTRRITSYGVRATESFAAAFAATGVAVVSGMAIGVDTRAHRAALETGGLTAAVLGCGADIPYPGTNRWLYERIVAKGVVISELPPGAPPAPWTFPHRNRLLAALGDAVLVVEAPVTSGALQTADAALELGRSVYSVPGTIYSEGHRGCNKLIYDGAGPAFEPCVTVEDFLKQTRIERGTRQAQGGRLSGADPATVSASGGLGSRNDKVWAALGAGATSVDGLVGRTGLSARELSAALAGLELEGLVRRVGPGIWARGP